MSNNKELIETLLTDDPDKESATKAFMIAKDARQSTAELNASRYLKYFYAPYETDDSDTTSILLTKLNDTEWTDGWVETVMKPRNGQSAPNPSSLCGYYKMLAILVTALYSHLPDIKDLPLYNYYCDRMNHYNHQSSTADLQQKRDFNESSRWVTPILIVKNMLLLKLRAQQYEHKDHSWHFKFLIYLLYVLCGPSVAAFRLDVVYSIHLYDVAVETSERNKSHNYFIFDSSDPHRPVTAEFNYFKNSGSRGPSVFQLPMEFLQPLIESVQKFPRRFFIPAMKNLERQMLSSEASQFVKRAWILDDRDVRPGADDIRSAFITLFYITHPRAVDRVEYGNRSMTTTGIMEVNYVKTEEDTYLQMVHNDGQMARNGFKDVTLSEDEKQRVKFSKKRKA